MGMPDLRFQHRNQRIKYLGSRTINGECEHFNGHRQPDGLSSLRIHLLLGSLLKPALDVRCWALGVIHN